MSEAIPNFSGMRLDACQGGIKCFTFVTTEKTDKKKTKTISRCFGRNFLPCYEDRILSKMFIRKIKTKLTPREFPIRWEWNLREHYAEPFAPAQ